MGLRGVTLQIKIQTTDSTVNFFFLIPKYMPLFAFLHLLVFRCTHVSGCGGHFGRLWVTCSLLLLGPCVLWAWKHVTWISCSEYKILFFFFLNLHSFYSAGLKTQMFLFTKVVMSKQEQLVKNHHFNERKHWMIFKGHNFFTVRMLFIFNVKL